ncbi:MAG: imidazolonepropionase [Gammaproteobacteria bacterium]
MTEAAISGPLVAADADCFAVTDGRISAVGERVRSRQIVDLGESIVLPGLIDCHTHLVYAGDRMAEHALRLSGASYADIARAGGGIRSTVRSVREASESELVDAALPRIHTLLREGVTRIEIKSGYGLDLENELKMLRVIRELDRQTPVHLHATFLGAHAIPEDSDPDSYINEVTQRMLPAVAEQGLAEAVDIFVENIGFSLAHLGQLAAATADHGLNLRVHAEQLSAMGGSGRGARLGAVSCDHLEYAAQSDVDAMATAATVAVLLPGAFYFLGETRKPPVAALRAAGVPMAVATDHNPGSSPLLSLLTSAHMAATLFGLSPAEALAGITRHAGRALGKNDAGSLTLGSVADFTVWDIPGPEFLLYQLGGLYPVGTYIGGVSV